MSNHTEIAPQSLEERYGDRRPSRRWLVVALGALLVGALLVWSVWAIWLSSDKAIQADVSSYEVISAHEVRVRVAAQFRDADVKGSCLLRATASDHTVVGELNLTAAELRAAQGRWIPIRTERRATTATLVRCSD